MLYLYRTTLILLVFYKVNLNFAVLNQSKYIDYGETA